MNVFGSYAQYYDLLYRDKDYDGEARFTNKLIQKYAPNAKHLLELGCGTGIHAEKLAAKGYTVHGIDISAEMLKRAEDRLRYLPKNESEKLSFSCGDIRQFRHRDSFNAVISLFHVMSYQTKNSDLAAVFNAVKQHLHPKGIFIFDCWYGPAVLSDPPVVRVKRLEDKKIEVIRIAEPKMSPNNNRVDVHYQVFVKNKSTGEVEIFEETHRMRYLFMPEIINLCEVFGFFMLDFREWLTNNPPGLDTWGVYFVVGL